MLKTRYALAAVLAAAVVAPAHAQTIQLNNIAPTWSNVTPGNVSDLSTDNSGSIVRLSWGETRNDKSSFVFDDRETPLNIVLSGGTARFSLGQFTHINNVISGTSLTGARLNLLFGLTSANPSSFSTFVTLNHEETPNGGTCPYGTTAQNANGCADRVTLGTLPTAQAFVFNSQSYFFSILGFSSSSSTYTPISEVVTAEGSSNKVYLWAEVSRANVVPEPSTYALMATGLAGLVGVARRRRAAK